MGGVRRARSSSSGSISSISSSGTSIAGTEEEAGTVVGVEEEDLATAVTRAVEAVEAGEGMVNAEDQLVGVRFHSGRANGQSCDQNGILEALAQSVTEAHSEC